MLDFIHDIQSLTTFRRRSGEFIRQLKDTQRPIVLTVNGKAAAIVQDAEAYQGLLEAASQAGSPNETQSGITSRNGGRRWTYHSRYARPRSRNRSANVGRRVPQGA